MNAPVTLTFNITGSMPVIRNFPILLCLLLCSCDQEDQIRQYRAAKETLSTPSGVAKAVTSGGQVWFFKLMTQDSAFEKFSNEFARMIIGADATQGVPKFVLPEGWTASPGPPPIYQTIQVAEDEKQAALTVTPLPAPTDDPVAYLKSNVDRWRRQLGLTPLTSKNWLAEAMQSSEIVSIPKGNEFITLVHIQGTTEKMGKTEMLVAMISPTSLTGTAAMATRPESASSPTSGGQVTYDLPEGWKESPGNSMRLVSLSAEHESGIADFSVIRLPGGGDLLPNINRWRGQVKLEPLEQAALDKSLETVEIDGSSGKLSLLEGPEQSILAAIIEQDGVKWFFKMQGPTASVKAEETHFREFLKSVKLNLKSE